MDKSNTQTFRSPNRHLFQALPRQDWMNASATFHRLGFLLEVLIVDQVIAKVLFLTKKYYVLYYLLEIVNIYFEIFENIL